MKMFRYRLCALTLILAGCQALEEGDAPDSSASASGVKGGQENPPSPVDAGVAEIEIYVQGSLQPRTFTDGLSGQTPQMQTMEISRLELMRSASDQNPVQAFDHGLSPVTVDMLAAQTLAGSARSSLLPPGTYTHAKVLMTVARFTVDATTHSVMGKIHGKLTVTTALSDSFVNGTWWVKGKAEYHFVSGAIDYRVPGTIPALPSTGGGTIISEPGKTWLLIPLTGPFLVDPAHPAPASATIVYEVFESFRWEDLSTAGYAAAQFDLDGATMSFEPVHNFGATDYRTQVP